jgi:hypothetical protein
LDKVTKSRIKLLLFAGIVAVLFLASLITGYLKRDELQALGGPVLVEVTNKATERLRADVYVGSQFATLELDPEGQGLLRFSPRRQESLRIVLVRKSERLLEENYSTLQPKEKRQIGVTILGPDDLEFTEAGRENDEAENG